MNDEAPAIPATPEVVGPTIPGPGPGQAVGYSLLWALAMAVSAGMVLLLGRLLELGRIFTWSVCLTLGYALASAFMVWLIIRNSGGNWRPYFPLRRTGIRGIAITVVAGVAIVYGVVTLLGLLPFYDRIRLHLTGDDFRPAVLVLCVRGVVGPIFEELMFRGWILYGFMNRYTPRKAIVLSSLLFGLLHLNPVMIAYAFLIGCLFAWMVKRTGSLNPAIAAHIVANTMATILGIIATR